MKSEMPKEVQQAIRNNSRVHRMAWSVGMESFMNRFEKHVRSYTNWKFWQDHTQERIEHAAAWLRSNLLEHPHRLTQIEAAALYYHRIYGDNKIMIDAIDAVRNEEWKKDPEGESFIIADAIDDQHLARIKQLSNYVGGYYHD